MFIIFWLYSPEKLNFNFFIAKIKTNKNIIYMCVIIVIIKIIKQVSLTTQMDCLNKFQYFFAIN
jgi:hypothetical protein